MGGRRDGFLLEKDVLESRKNSLMTLKARGFAQLFIGTSKKADQEMHSISAQQRAKKEEPLV